MTAAMYMCAYAMLSLFIIMRLFIKKRSRSAIARASFMLFIIAVCTIDLIVVVADNTKSTTTLVNILNVLLILFFVRAIREVWLQFIQVVVKSVPVFIIIFAYFIIYILTGFILFANSEIDESFATINESLYTVFILFTVSNYPDIELPYFEESRLAMLYFWSFLLIGIFLLSNLLLAQIFLNYKKLMNKKLKKYESDVKDYFEEIFNKLTDKKPEDKKYLTTEEITEMLGGTDVVDSDKRLVDLLWQSQRILDDQIHLQDFAYLMQFTDTPEQ